MIFDDVRAVFTDMDGTLTTGGKLLPSTYDAIAALDAAGIPVIVVTGRPSSWGEAIARLWPVRAVITENGGVTYLPSARGLKKQYAVPPKTLPAVRRRMHAAARAVMKKFRGARLSVDAFGTEVDLAIDWNEEARLSLVTAKRIEEHLRERGWNAVRSSVHINFWPRGFDKLTACKKVIRSLFGAGGTTDLAAYLYVGDALNDEPMFQGFPRSVGVANVRDVWDELAHRPAHVTAAPYGHGFEELVRQILTARESPL